VKKLGLTALAIVVALGMLGIGYAYWTDKLVITGNANTGNLHLIITGVQSEDPENTLDPGYGYDAADTIVVAGGDQKSASITINNAYPGYKTGATVSVQNTGTVPVKVQSITLKYDSGNPALFRYMSLIDWTFDGGKPAIGYVLVPGASKDFVASFSFDTDLPYQDAGVAVHTDIVVTQFNDPAVPTMTIAP
jgi:predicted ribosomally synthesized peptide with SipW-like signal peptide